MSYAAPAKRATAQFAVYRFRDSVAPGPLRELGRASDSAQLRRHQLALRSLRSVALSSNLVRVM